MNKYRLVTTAKLEGQTEDLVTKSAEKQNPGYKVTKIEDKGDKWQVRLDQAEKVSTRTRQAAPPPFLKEKDDAGDSADDAPDDEEASESSEEEDAEDSGEKPDDDAESKDKGDSGDKPKGDKKDPAAAIEDVINQLKGLFEELGGHASDLKEKADKVDEIHEMSKGTGDVDKMDAVPPVPPLDDAAAVGPTPGPPVPPRKPPVPSGNAPGRPGAGVPGVFGSRNVEIVEHPIKDDEGEYSLSDVLTAINTHPDLTDYEIDEVKAVSDDNVYVAKLKKKN